MNSAEEITKPEQFLADLMVLLGSDEMEWEAVQDHAVKLLKDWREQYTSIREKETAIKFIKHQDHNEGLDTTAINYEKIYDEWYTKHKQQ